ncbi:MAG: hypothetical protein UX49_C0020G0011 [Candidatus Wolfebacteria bacterium GW2011_GWC2_46_275]|nr:MAG: hypothetical protein UX49_C0020G0011 [Candidatus Wolfebacteria bacterium GW2011_GWC2_46_275]KKU41579.1 MAG: hypothetical protein UX58_C0007G0020 [Candidatus Wolfebacteria bacterium GW2011_GWB2_46_69]KKU53506.1 MAG: hypothetical protein UX76_C0014G0002 [Candidatus Wolfebacteria bacterium GW2011_GWC1_47_103]KKU59869.1 MAG: hypothetical protein UX83_C0002G0156 [Candidatus Wolfebacteria bacterium GW2011_GWE2_47_12]KKU65861.1 MAG: hypothetical protein UX90_C0002G0237 [Candidatus Wolfebacteri
MEEQQKEGIIAQYLEKDAELLGENGIAGTEQRDKGTNGNSEQGSIKNHYWKFIGGFFALLLVGFIGIPAIGMYIQKQEDMEFVEGMERNQQAMSELQERLKNDKDGGATPEETLQLFTAALKKGDIEQAEKYFVIEPQKRQDMLIANLDRIRAEGKFETLLDYLGKAKLEKDSNSSDNNVWFSYLENGRAQIGVEITKDKYSSVWKIENLAF